MADLVSLLLDTLPKNFLLFIPLSVFLALIIFFSNRQNKEVDGRSKFNIFVNSCIIFLLLIVTYIYILYSIALVFPQIPIDNVIASVVFLAWYLLIWGLIILDKLGSGLNRTKLYTILINSLDLIYLIGACVPLGLLILALWRLGNYVYPANAEFLLTQIPTTLYVCISAVFYSIAAYVVAGVLEKRYKVQRKFRLPPGRGLVLALLITLGSMLIIFNLINGEYSRSTLSEVVTFHGPLTEQNSTTLQTTYEINLTRPGLRDDFPLEFRTLNETPQDNEVQKYASGTYWLNKSRLEKGKITIVTIKNVSTVEYLSFLQPGVYPEEGFTRIHLDLNFTGKEVRSERLLLTQNFNANCQNLTINLNKDAYRNYFSPGNWEFYTGADYSDHNGYEFWYNNDTRDIWFRFNVLHSERVLFDVYCLTKTG